MKSVADYTNCVASRLSLPTHVSHDHPSQSHDLEPPAVVRCQCELGQSSQEAESRHGVSDTEAESRHIVCDATDPASSPGSVNRPDTVSESSQPESGPGVGCVLETLRATTLTESVSQLIITNVWYIFFQHSS